MPLALHVLALGFFSAVSGASALDSTMVPGATGLLPAATEFAQKLDGPLGSAAFAAVHTLAIVLCFPGTVLFELAAGALYGLGAGVFVVAAAKGLAATITWFLVQTLRDGPLGLWVQERASAASSRLLGSAPGSAGAAAGERASQLRAAVARGGFRFCLLARLSPLPSWANNYGLPLLGAVGFETYFPATLLGMMLPLVSNVYSGTVASSLAAVFSGAGGGATSALSGPGLALSALSAVSAGALIQQLATYAGSEVSEGEAEGQAERPR